MQFTLHVYFSLQWGFIHQQTVQQQVRIRSAFFTRKFACSKPRRNEAPLSGCVADAVLGSWSKPEMMKLIQSKQILLLSTWQKQLFIFNDTFLIKFARKRSGPHTKITDRIILLNFSHTKKIGIILLKFSIHQKMDNSS
jgi:hypothetical protein